MLYVKLENGAVTKVWDTAPPTGEAGWKEAVEVRPTLVPNRQMYSSHRFDLTTTPVQIIYDAVPVSVESRKMQMKSQVDQAFKQVVEEQSKNMATYNAAAVETARQTALTKQAAIDAATTHDQLDLIV